MPFSEAPPKEVVGLPIQPVESGTGGTSASTSSDLLAASQATPNLCRWPKGRTAVLTDCAAVCGPDENTPQEQMTPANQGGMTSHASRTVIGKLNNSAWVTANAFHLHVRTSQPWFWVGFLQASCPNRLSGVQKRKRMHSAVPPLTEEACQVGGCWQAWRGAQGNCLLPAIRAHRAG